MHEAYRHLAVLRNLPLQIECIACWSEERLQKSSSASLNNSDLEDNGTGIVPKATLLVGTKPGHLLVYTVEFNTNSNRPDVKLERSNKTFSKKPIQQLYVCVELRLILSLSDSLVSVHDLTTFQLITIIQKSKGATCFSADVESKISSLGEVASTLRLCIAAKKKIQFYFWKKRDFYELRPDISMPEIPKCMAWCKDSVCLGFKRDYYIVSMKPNALPQELFPTGKTMEPVMLKFDEQKVILVKDDMSIFVDNSGKTDEQVFKWSDCPVALESQAPYVLAILPMYVEVRAVEPGMQIQNLEFARARFFTKWREWIFVASASNVWGIIQYSSNHQIEELLKEKQFELALKLANMKGDGSAISDQVKNIQNLFAFELFCQGRYDESLKNFADLGTDPAQVIGLYPDLLPSDFRKFLSYPSDPPNLTGIQLEKGLSALIEYLTEKRRNTMRQQRLPPSFPIVEGNKIIRSRTSLLQIIDTTLMKCYLRTNDALVAPLLRLPDNFCHVEECEKELKNANKHQELIILYKKNKFHRKALALLMGQKLDQNDNAQEAIVEYLQHLGEENLSLIFEFAPTVLQINENDGLRIFTEEDIPEVESLPKRKVYDFLQNESPDLGLKYLEHLVYDAGDKTSDFHNKLVLAYQAKVESLMESHQDELPEVDKYSAMRGPTELIELRSKLRCFLEMSTFYEAGRLLDKFKNGDLKEEYAVLLGKDGQHEKALGIYAKTLQKPEMAEEYCRKVYDEGSSSNKDVFLSLLKMYLLPQNDEISPGESSSKPDLDAAYRILKEHASRINCIEALDILPANTDVKDIRQFLENVIERLKETRRETDVLENLMLTEKFLVHEKRMYCENRRCDITDEVVCAVCQKRVGDSAFAWYPNGVIVHYFCSKDRKVAPRPRN